MAIAHFAVGTMATALLLALIAPRLLRSPTVLVAGGVWGMIPDIHWVLPRGSELVRSFHTTPYANLFWFHHFLDASETGQENLEAGASLLLLLVAVGIYYLENDWDAA